MSARALARLALVTLSTSTTGLAVAAGGVAVLVDTPPTVTVSLPTPGTVGRPFLHLTASCADDQPAGCVSFAVTANGTTMLTAASLLDQDISLSAFEGLEVSLVFIGTDSAGQSSSVSRTVYVDSSPALTETVHATGPILDESAAFLLFRTGSSPVVLDRTSGVALVMAAPPDYSASGLSLPYGYTSSRGAVAVYWLDSPASCPTCARLVELRDNIQTALAGSGRHGNGRGRLSALAQHERHPSSLRDLGHDDEHFGRLRAGH